MSKVVNDDYPKNQPQLSDKELKEMVMNNHVNTGAPSEFTKGESVNVPTEVIALPSKGLFYPEGHPLKSGQIEHSTFLRFPQKCIIQRESSDDMFSIVVLARRRNEVWNYF